MVTEACPGCDRPLDGADAVSAWLDTALGMACVRTHEGCQGAAAQRHPEQPARWRRSGPPVGKDERLRRRASEARKATPEEASAMRRTVAP